MGTLQSFWALICDSPLPNMTPALKVLCLPKLHDQLRAEYSNLGAEIGFSWVLSELREATFTKGVQVK